MDGRRRYRLFRFGTYELNGERDGGILRVDGTSAGPVTQHGIPGIDCG
ncbi:hypothetical protein [Streptomyces incanus]|uniref:Uncharacterized protein n=1 Tax=Streptomyces incanus TaxID=887453 RepID=A0ABW0XL93_9ACTN